MPSETEGSAYNQRNVLIQRCGQITAETSSAQDSE